MNKLAVGVLAILLLLGGCIGESATEQPEIYTEVSEVVEYETLNRQQQSAFRDALQNDVYFVPNSSYIDKPNKYNLEEVSVFEEYDYVRYEGALYQTNLESGQMYATYGIRTTVGTPSDNDTVTKFSDLPKGVQDEVETAIVEGNYYAPAGKWDSLPEPLDDTDYMRYDNRTYRMSYVYGDRFGRKMAVKKVK